MSKIEHELKCWPGPYDAIAEGRKLFEYRKNDRGYEVGDILYLRRFQPVGNIYTGASVRMVITYVLRAGFGVPDGYAVLGISSLDAADALQALQASVSAAGAAQPASAAVIESCKQAVRDEPELDDEMPDEMFDYMTQGREQMSEALRAVVRATKLGILERIDKLPTLDPASAAVPEGEFWELLHEWRETLDTERADWIENRINELWALSAHGIKEHP